MRGLFFLNARFLHNEKYLPSIKQEHIPKTSIQNQFFDYGELISKIDSAISLKSDRYYK